MYRRRNYRGLLFFVLINYSFAAVVALSFIVSVTLVGSVATFVGTIGSAAESTNVDSSVVAPIIGSTLLTCVFAFASALIHGPLLVYFLACAESIKIFMDIEDNTHKTKLSFRTTE